MNTTTTIIVLSTLIFVTNCTQCDVSGLCSGQILQSDTSGDKIACWSLCKSTDGCTWFSFNTAGDQTCILLEDCPEIEENLQFVSGQKECNYGGQYLIAGGSLNGDDTMTEIVTLVNNNSTPSFGQLPFHRSIAVGAMLGNGPILCGGYNGSDSVIDNCISYRQDSEWSQSQLMAHKREVSAGVKVNTTTFWILGGYDGFSILDSTEFINQGQANGVPGPKLPYELGFMCAVKRSENEIFVIGGVADSDYTKDVWIYDPQNGFARTQGPSLTTERGYHSCSTMKDGKKTVLITAGGRNKNNGRNVRLDSVEIYDPTDNTWHSGPSLPYRLDSSAMAESPDGRGVLLFGGFSTENGFENKILEFRAGADAWNILNVSLEIARHSHLVIPLA